MLRYSTEVKECRKKMIGEHFGEKMEGGGGGGGCGGECDNCKRETSCVLSKDFSSTALFLVECFQQLSSPSSLGELDEEESGKKKKKGGRGGKKRGEEKRVTVKQLVTYFSKKKKESESEVSKVSKGLCERVVCKMVEKKVFELYSVQNQYSSNTYLSLGEALPLLLNHSLSFSLHFLSPPPKRKRTSLPNKTKEGEGEEGEEGEEEKEKEEEGTKKKRRKSGLGEVKKSGRKISSEKSSTSSTLLSFIKTNKSAPKKVQIEEEVESVLGEKKREKVKSYINLLEDENVSDGEKVRSKFEMLFKSKEELEKATKLHKWREEKSKQLNCSYTELLPDQLVQDLVDFANNEEQVSGILEGSLAFKYTFEIFTLFSQH